MIATIETEGCLISYKVEGHGEPAIFIQGVGLHGDGWLPQTLELTSRFQCVTFDNRGMGSSQPAGCEITVAQMAQDTLAVMHAAGNKAEFQDDLARSQKPNWHTSHAIECVS
jgi:pimeloyl-ACP methyl ester carboxylesterase